MNRLLLYNGFILTQAKSVIADSIAIERGMIVAVGRRLENDPVFTSFSRYNLKGKTVIPGLVDAHTHFYYYALSLGRVSLHGTKSIAECLARIRTFCKSLPKDAWVVGEGYRPDEFTPRREPDRLQLDSVTGGRPAFIFSKDEHTAWVNSKALELAGITTRTAEPDGGQIVRFPDRSPSGLLREGPAYLRVFDRIPPVQKKSTDRLYQRALEIAWRKGVTGVHSFDGPDGFAYFATRAEKRKLGLRITHYPGVKLLPELLKTKTVFGTGDDFLRIAGVKIFADGSLGSQSALMFKGYEKDRKNRGLEVTSTATLVRLARQAARLGLPCAVHAIGDKAVANVLDAFAQLPPLKNGARHRIEHVQCIRPADIKRMKQLNIIASVQPSHCPSDINMVREHWGERGRNAYVFRSLLDAGIDLCFGSDVPIEPLDPSAGIAAAVRRARPGSGDRFYPEQSLTPAEALYRFTVGPALAAGQINSHGFLLPGFKADLAILPDNPLKIAASRLYTLPVLATMLDGRFVYADSSLKL